MSLDLERSLKTGEASVKNIFSYHVTLNKLGALDVFGMRKLTHDFRVTEEAIYANMQSGKGFGWMYPKYMNQNDGSLPPRYFEQARQGMDRILSAKEIILEGSVDIAMSIVTNPAGLQMPRDRYRSLFAAPPQLANDYK